jgi:hypothetical protein
MQSRGLVPSYQNTVNAAICLDELARYDEALELYEAALIDFANDLTPELRGSLEPKLRELRDRIASLEISGNVNGTVVVDGRERGKLPFTVPLRILPGERTVRVIKEGYETFEKKLKLLAKEAARVDAVLKPLASAGRLRVEVADGEGAELRVDGAAVGRVPWEGTLAPGNHVYEVTRDDQGSGPQRVSILQSQTALVRALLKPLGRVVRFVVTPPTARLTVDDMELDSAWQGRLTVGMHRMAGREEGYFPGTRELHVGPATAGNIDLSLKVDADHPRWAKGTPAKIWAEAFGGYALAPTLGSRAEECSDPLPCSDKQLGHGPVVGVRGAYELPIRVSLELSAAYVSLSTALRRSTQQPFSEPDPVPVTFELRDEINLTGALVAAGVGYRQPFGKILGVQGRVHFGALINNARDTITGDASAPGHGSAPAVIQRSGAEKQGAALVIAPEIQANITIGHLRVGAGLSLLILPFVGPQNDHGDLYPEATPPCSDTDMMPDLVGCTPGSKVIEKERLFGPFVAFTPVLSAGYEF